MAFTDFKSIQQAQQAFGIRYAEENYLDYDELAPSAAFLEEFTFSRHNIDIYSSEASRCENIIYPLIRDVFKHYASVYALWSHKSLAYDEMLTGIPDYLITYRSPLGKTIPGLPILVVVEAKQNNFSEGWGQCLAELVAAQKLNGKSVFPVHGIVTDGEFWQFGKLESDIFTRNEVALTIAELSKISGALGFILRSKVHHHT